MTKGEFWEWFCGHCAAFTGLGSWYERLPKEPTAAGASQRETLGKWYEVLRDIDQADAIEATRLMFRDDVDVHPDRHPAKIRSIASKLAALRQTREKAANIDRSRPWANCPVDLFERALAALRKGAKA